MYIKWAEKTLEDFTDEAVESSYDVENYFFWIHSYLTDICLDKSNLDAKTGRRHQKVDMDKNIINNFKILA